MIDPFYASLMVPVDIQLDSQIMMEAIDNWRYSRERCSTILHILAMVRRLCTSGGTRPDSTKDDLPFTYVSSTMSAILLCPPVNQPPIHVSLVRAYIVRYLYLPHLLVALQEWMAEMRDAVFQDSDRHRIVQDVVTRVKSEKDSHLTRGLILYLMSMLQTAPFSQNVQALRELASHVLHERVFEPTLGREIQETICARAIQTIRICEQFT
jgi:hypothetical protein